MNPLVDVAAVLVVGGLHHRHVHVCQGALPRRRVRRKVVEGAAPVPCAAELLALLGRAVHEDLSITIKVPD